LWEKIIISAVLSFVIYQVMNYINLKRQNKILFRVNKCILQATMMYFANKDIKESEIEKFESFAKERIANHKLDEWVADFRVKMQEKDKLQVFYKFRRSKTDFQNISYEIKKNICSPEENGGDVEDEEKE